MRSTAGITEEKENDCREFLKSLVKMAKGTGPAEFATITKALPQFNERDDAAGGVSVIPTIDAMIGKLQREFSNARQFCSVATIGTDKWEQLIRKQTNGALRRSQLDNFDDATKKDRYGRVSIMVDDLFSIIPFSDNLIMDSAFSVVNDILSSAAEDFTITEGSEWVNGSTGDGLKGFLTYAEDSAGGNSFDKIERVTTGAAGVFDFDDLFNTIYALKFVYLPNAVLGANRLTMREMRKLKDTQDRYLWEFSNQVGQPARVAGVPVTEIPELAAPSGAGTYTTGDEPIVVADFRSGYQIVDRLGITTTRDNLTQYPDIVMKLKKRSGGGLKKGECIKVLKVQ